MSSDREGWFGCYYGSHQDGELKLLQADEIICSRSHGRSVAEIKLHLGHPCHLGLSTKQDGYRHWRLEDSGPIFSLKKKTFKFSISFDLQKSCKTGTEFSHTQHQVSLVVNILYLVRWSQLMNTTRQSVIVKVRASFRFPSFISNVPFLL